MKYKKTTIAAGALLVLGGSAWAAYLYYTVDEDPPQDADLAYSREAVPYEENGFPVLAAAGKVEWPEEPDVRGTAFSDHWDGEVVRKVLEQNQELLTTVDEALRLPRFQFPESGGPDLLAGRGWTSITSLLELRMEALFKEGRERQALDEALKLIRWGHQVEGADGRLSEYHRGLSIKRAGLDRFSLLLSKSKLEAIELEPFLQEISKYAAQDEGLARAFKNEYRGAADFFDRLSRGDEGAYRQLDLPNGRGSRGIKWVLNPQKTRRLFAENCRASLEAIAGRKGSPAIPIEAGFKIPWLPPKNAVGKILLEMVSSGAQSFLKRFREEKLLYAKTVLLLACKCYQRREGKLPSALDDLIPRYLKELPLDPYDGRPLRYSAAKKINWSVGVDRKDAGGSVEEVSAQFDEFEPTFRIEF